MKTSKQSVPKPEQRYMNKRDGDLSPLAIHNLRTKVTGSLLIHLHYPMKKH